LWNITIQSADIAYTDALEFYASVRESVKNYCKGGFTAGFFVKWFKSFIIRYINKIFLE